MIANQYELPVIIIINLLGHYETAYRWSLPIRHNHFQTIIVGYIIRMVSIGYCPFLTDHHESPYLKHHQSPYWPSWISNMGLYKNGVPPRLVVSLSIMVMKHELGWSVSITTYGQPRLTTNEQLTFIIQWSVSWNRLPDWSETGLKRVWKHGKVPYIESVCKWIHTGK